MGRVLPLERVFELGRRRDLAGRAAVSPTAARNVKHAYSANKAIRPRIRADSGLKWLRTPARGRA